MKRVGVALGGGGVRGFAHVPALETIDACGIKPVALAGTSMGAIIGALYASGQSGAEIREIVRKHTVSRHDRFKDVLAKKTFLLEWWRGVSFERGRGGLVRIDGFLRYLFNAIRVTRFEELKIPFHVVATDFWSGKEVVFSSGDLLPAIRASMAIPGVFAPVVVGGRVLVDGGVVNNVPYDQLLDHCDCTIAIDVTPKRWPGRNPVPNMKESFFGMFDILVETAMARKLQALSPTIYFHPEIDDITPLEFDKTDAVLKQAEAGMEKLRREIMRVVNK